MIPVIVLHSAVAGPNGASPSAHGRERSKQGDGRGAAAAGHWQPTGVWDALAVKVMFFAQALVQRGCMFRA
eukprot:12126749-Alexandrium_andersonii.AAC.1